VAICLEEFLKLVFVLIGLDEARKPALFEATRAAAGARLASRTTLANNVAVVPQMLHRYDVLETLSVRVNI